jgi:hypothetical protein
MSLRLFHPLSFSCLSLSCAVCSVSLWLSRLPMPLCICLSVSLCLCLPVPSHSSTSYKHLLSSIHPTKLKRETAQREERVTHSVSYRFPRLYRQSERDSDERGASSLPSNSEAGEEVKAGEGEKWKGQEMRRREKKETSEKDEEQEREKGKRPLTDVPHLADKNQISSITERKKKLVSDS